MQTVKKKNAKEYQILRLGAAVLYAKNLDEVAGEPLIRDPDKRSKKM